MKQEKAVIGKIQAKIKEAQNILCSLGMELTGLQYHAKAKQVFEMANILRKWSLHAPERKQGAEK
jgi:uncharacterized protein HemY